MSPLAAPLATRAPPAAAGIQELLCAVPLKPVSTAPCGWSTGAWRDRAARAAARGLTGALRLGGGCLEAAGFRAGETVAIVNGLTGWTRRLTR
jgi:hypothetical protein